MKKYELDFGSFVHHDDGIFETIVNQDVEVTKSNTEELFNLIKSIEPSPSQILVNRINRYSYTFRANVALATSNLAENVAVIKYGRMPWPISGLLTPKFYHLAFFDDRESGVKWLHSKIKASEK